MTEQAPLPYLPVEPAFDQIVEAVGGVRVDSLFSFQIDWENADYFIREAGVVAELKEIKVDLNEDAALRIRLGDILHKHAGQEGVPLVFGTRKVRIDLLPDECRREIVLPFKRKLEVCVKKAARQIKETKARLNVPHARGLLILVNDASTFLRPDLAFFFLHHILNGQYSSIDQVVYCSINMLVEAPCVPDGARFWANGIINGRNSIEDSFMKALYEAYQNVIDAQTGVPGVPVFYDSNLTEPLAFIKRKHADNPEFFIRPKRFYRNNLGFYYYCESVQDGTARIYLVESWQRGQLIQALFDQKLIYATKDRYEEVNDREQISKFRKQLQKLLKS